MPFGSPDPGLPVWPLPLVAAFSLFGAAAAFVLGVRDILRARPRKEPENDGQVQ